MVHIQDSSDVRTIKSTTAMSVYTHAHTHTQTHTQTHVYLLIGKHQKKVLQLLVDGPHLSQLDNRVVQRTVG